MVYDVQDNQFAIHCMYVRIINRNWVANIFSLCLVICTVKWWGQIIIYSTYAVDYEGSVSALITHVLRWVHSYNEWLWLMDLTVPVYVRKIKRHTLCNICDVKGAANHNTLMIIYSSNWELTGTWDEQIEEVGIGIGAVQSCVLETPKIN